MNGIRETIAKMGDGRAWYYDAWMGLSPDFIEPWYSAQCERSDDSGSISGPHRATLAEAEADVTRMMPGDEFHKPYDIGYVTKQVPALKITVEKEITGCEPIKTNPTLRKRARIEELIVKYSRQRSPRAPSRQQMLDDLKSLL